jgi:hypothetical protein
MVAGDGFLKVAKSGSRCRRGSVTSMISYSGEHPMAFNAWGADPGTIHAEEPLEREPPRLLMRESSPADPFPIAALGTVLAPAARGINDRVRAPMAICGQAVLAAAALAVQGHANVVLPYGQLKPLSIYCITVAAERGAQEFLR